MISGKLTLAWRLEGAAPRLGSRQSICGSEFLARPQGADEKSPARSRFFNKWLRLPVESHRKQRGEVLGFTQKRRDHVTHFITSQFRCHRIDSLTDAVAAPKTVLCDSNLPVRENEEPLSCRTS